MSTSVNKLSIQRAFTKKKILQERLQKMRVENEYVGIQSKTCELNPRILKAPQLWQQKEDLEAQLRHLRREIHKANVSNTITVMGQEMTVAEALAERELLPERKLELDRLKSQFHNKFRTVETKNDESFQRRKNDKEITQDELENWKPVYSLYDPINLQEKIEALEKFIFAFECDLKDSLVEHNNLHHIDWPQHFE